MNRKFRFGMIGGAIAIVLAQELGKVLNEPLAVDRAEFVESQQTQIYKF